MKEPTPISAEKTHGGTKMEFAASVPSNDEEAFRWGLDIERIELAILG